MSIKNIPIDYLVYKIPNILNPLLSHIFMHLIKHLKSQTKSVRKQYCLLSLSDALAPLSNHFNVANKGRPAWLYRGAMLNAAHFYSECVSLGHQFIVFPIVDEYPA